MIHNKEKKKIRKERKSNVLKNRKKNDALKLKRKYFAIIVLLYRVFTFIIDSQIHIVIDVCFFISIINHIDFNIYFYSLQ